MALECERLADSCSISDERSKYILKKTECLKNEQNYDECFIALSSLNADQLPDSLAYKCRYETALMALLTNNMETLHLQLLYLEGNKETSKHINEYFILKVLYFNQMNDYANAYQSAAEYLDKRGLNTTEKDSLKKLLSKLYTQERPRIISTKKLAVYSAILPGSAQMVHSHFGEGLSSLLINGGLVSLAVYDLANALYFNSFAVLSNLLPRFYLAGIKRAKEIGIEENQIEMNRFNEKTIKILSK